MEETDLAERNFYITHNYKIYKSTIPQAYGKAIRVMSHRWLLEDEIQEHEKKLE
jgi:hypothetical protein